MRLLPLLMIVPLLVWNEPQTVITVPAGGDVRAAAIAIPCNGLVKIQAGATFDVSTPIVLPNKNCPLGSDPVITTSATLLDARVNPSLASSMPRLRAVNSDGVFRLAPGAGWVLDGLNLTDNNGTNTVNMLVDAMAAGTRLTVQRSLLYPKEAITAPTNYQRPLIRGVWAGGSTFNFTKNHAWGFMRLNSQGQSQDRSILLTMRIENMNVYDNFLEDNYMSIFTGGGGEAPEFTGTVTNPTMTTATMSNTSGLVPGTTFLRLEARGSGVWNSSTSFTRTGGAGLTSNDINHTIWFTHSTGTWRAKITAVSGDNVTLESYGGPQPRAGETVQWTEFMAALVKSVSGSTVTYGGSQAEVGKNWLTQVPSTAPNAVGWRLNQAVGNIDIRRNTFSIDIAAARAEFARSGFIPKGWMEFKAGGRITIDGNEFINFPSVIAFTQHSNEGATPWTKINFPTVANNFVRPIYDPNGSRHFIILALTDPYNSDEPGCCGRIENNLVLNCASLMQSSGNRNTIIKNNTVINDKSSAVYGSTAVIGDGVSHEWTFTDNIIGHLRYGMPCFISPNTLSTCFPSGVFRNNVVVDTENASVNVNTWGTASILSPIVKSFPEVGFVNVAANDYRLSSSSPYKGKGTNGEDPGVKWPQLVSALGFDPAGGPMPSPTPAPSVPLPSPSPSPQPTATVAPTATPTPTPQPSPSVSPTPIATPTPSSCTIEVPASVTLPANSSGVITVRLNSTVAIPLSATAIATSGQITVMPPPRQPSVPIPATSAVLQFSLRTKKRSASVRFDSTCGQKFTEVLIR